MSTTCQLRFVERGNECVAQVYMNSDGYPEEIIPNLDYLQRLLRASGAQRNASYTAAQFVFISKLQHLEQMSRCQNEIYSDHPDTVSEVLDIASWQDVEITPRYLLGHGVEDPSCGIRGNEDFLYLVELPSTSNGDWQVKIAAREHFPRWDSEDTTQAFEAAEWGFSESLEEAVAEIGSES